MPELMANDPVHLVIGGRLLPSRVRRRLKDVLYLDALREGDQQWTPSPGQEIVLRFEDDFSFWAQTARVEDIMDPIPVMVVRLVGEPREVEVRTAPRAQVGVPLEYSLMRPLAETYTTTTMDLSASGLRFPCAFQPWLGLELRLKLRLDQRPVTLVGRVVRISSVMEMRGRPAWVTAVQFVQPSPSARNLIAETVLKTLARAQNERRRRRSAPRTRRRPMIQ